MKALKVFLCLAVLAAVAVMGCKGGGESGKTGGTGGGGAPAVTGGGANFDTCVKDYTKYYKDKSQGQMSDELAKQTAETACTACKQDEKACKLIIDNLKNAP